MTVTQQHYKFASQLLADKQPDEAAHSEPYWEGYLDAVAWCVAGQPTVYDNNKPYTLGTMQRDAWAHGWLHRQQFVKALAKNSMTKNTKVPQQPD